MNLRHNSPGQGAFTRLELVWVLVTFALLTVVTFPVWGTGGPARSLVCLDNLRRLAVAWVLYAEEHKGRFPGNYLGDLVIGQQRPWASGWLDWTPSSANTNTAFLTRSPYSALGVYVHADPSIYKCPSDHYLSRQQALRGWRARVRSYSMNSWVGEGNQTSGPTEPAFTYFRSLGDFRTLSPQQTFVFAEEHPDSINDPLLWVTMGAPRWLDLPASYHEGTCWFAFADGHLEQHLWTRPTTVRPVRVSAYSVIELPSADPDLEWVRAHATEPQ